MNKDQEKNKNKKKHPIRNFFIVLLLIIAGTLLWSRYISTSGIVIKEYGTIDETLPVSFHGIKVVQFGDVHYGTTINDNEFKKLIQLINECKPDIVIFTGDLIDKSIKASEKDKNFIIEELSKLDPILGKFAVKGNHDYLVDGFDQIITDADFKLLKNESNLVYYKSETPIQIIGLPSFIKDHQDFTQAFTLDDDNNYYKIVITHEPDVIDDLISYNPNLMLSGHSHGGQVRLPFIGAVIKPNGAKKYYDEYYKVKETNLYITSGLGASNANFRFMNRPSFNLLRLYNH